MDIGFYMIGTSAVNELKKIFWKFFRIQHGCFLWIMQHFSEQLFWKNLWSFYELLFLELKCLYAIFSSFMAHFEQIWST